MSGVICQRKNTWNAWHFWVNKTVFWIYVAIATVGYAFFQFFSARAGGKIDGGFVPIIVNVIAVIVPLLFVLTKIVNKEQFVQTQRSGIMFSLLAGFSIATFAIAFHKIFQHGGNLSYVSPIIFGGSIALATSLSLIFLKETLSIYHVLGIFLVLTGLVFISLARAH